MNRIRQFFRRTGPDANAKRIRRRRAVVAFVSRWLPTVTLTLFVVGYLWMVLIPSPRLSRGTYIDENALQPGQVNIYWSWADVHAADRYLEKIEQIRDANSTSEQRAQFLMDEFSSLGLAASTQNYRYLTTAGTIKGTNTYAVLASPRTSGTEAMVISASWLSCTGGGSLNLRGVSTVLALAAFLKRYSLWAKDIVFVISDGYLDGMHAWLSAYHDSVQSNLHADHLTLSSGVIWTALNIDYSGHSFSHLGIFFEGVNGRLPNQDLLNSFYHISRYTGSVPVLVYDHLDPRENLVRRDELDVMPPWVPSVIRDDPEVREYTYQAKNVLRHVGYQARGRPSGVHGLFHQFRIDAITLFALPASGPHGFHAIGRIVESTLRTTNNLLERLHASFFFYILTGPDRFLKIGSYLPSAVLISVAMMFGGLRHWVDAGWVRTHSEESDQKPGSTDSPSNETWVTRPRPVLGVLGIMVATHAMGAVLFFLLTRAWFSEHQMFFSTLLCAIVSTIPLACLTLLPRTPSNVAPLSKVLNALNLCFASTVISITTVLNFSLAATLAVTLGIPLSLASPHQQLYTRLGKYGAYIVLAFGWMMLSEETRMAMWNWEVLGVWFAPFVCIVYSPLVLQAGIASLLPP